MFVGYVINLDARTDRLYNFYQHPDAKYFERVVAIDKNLIQQLDIRGGGGNFLFDNHHIKQTYQRDVTSGEIGCTLSHIRCWHKIANHEQLTDNDFALVAEDDVILCNSFAKNILYLQKVLKDYPDIDLVILQRLFSETSEAFKLALDEVERYNFFIFDQSSSFDNCGSSLYFIKKKRAKQILENLSNKKPYWLADGFSQFCESSKIRVASPLLGYIKDGINAESDLEIDRNIARNKGI